MISSTGYWSTGITVRWFPERPGHAEAWGGHLDYLDDGFLNDEPAAGRISTEGVLRTRYPVEDEDGVNVLAVVLDALIADAAKLGITWRGPMGGAPMIYYHGDGEGPDYPPPPGYRDLLRAQAERLGWATYGYTPTVYHWAFWTLDRRELVGISSGPGLATASAALRQFTDGEYDYEDTKSGTWREVCDQARIDVLREWDALHEDEKARLRPTAVSA